MITFDVYETQAFSSVLLSMYIKKQFIKLTILFIIEIINESDDCTKLRQIRKKNQQTDESLLSMIKQSILDSSSMGSIDLYTFIRYNLTGK